MQNRKDEGQFHAGQLCEEGHRSRQNLSIVLLCTPHVPRRHSPVFRGRPFDDTAGLHQQLTCMAATFFEDWTGHCLSIGGGTVTGIVMECLIYIS
jgi:hypothetical protein